MSLWRWEAPALRTRRFAPFLGPCRPSPSGLAGDIGLLYACPSGSVMRAASRPVCWSAIHNRLMSTRPSAALRMEVNTHSARCRSHLPFADQASLREAWSANGRRACFRGSALHNRLILIRASRASERGDTIGSDVLASSACPSPKCRSLEPFGLEEPAFWLGHGGREAAWIDDCLEIHRSFAPLRVANNSRLSKKKR